MAYTYLCVVIDSDSAKELADYTITANQQPFAQWKARKMFKEQEPKKAGELNWYVDILLLE